MSAHRGPGRPLGLVHVYAICTGAMFSSGFFLLPGLASDETGASLPLAYLLAGLLVVPALLSTAELATAFPRAGGPYHFFQRSLGPVAATVGALGLFVTMVLKSAFALVGIGAYLSVVVEVPAVPVAAGLALAFTVLNVLGTRESARLQVALVAVLLAVLVAFLAAGLSAVSGRDLLRDADEFSPFFADGATGLLAATAMVFVSYAGLLQVASIAGSVRDPGRTIPRGMALALGTATAIYVAGTAVMILVVDLDDLRDDTTPVATAMSSLPLPGGTALVVIAALAAFASTGNAGILSASRYPLALARDHLLAARFARLGRFGTPSTSVLTTGLLTAGVILVLDVEAIAKLASAFLLVVFGCLHVSVVVLRSGRVAGYRPTFRSPGAPAVQILGSVAAVVLIVDLGLLPIAFTGLLLVGGATWYAVAGRGHRDRDAGAVRQVLHRLSRGPVTLDALRQLQEEGPRGEDRAAEILADAPMVRLSPGTDIDEATGASAAALADRLGVDPAEVRRWVAGSRHLVVEAEPGRTVIHEVLLDSAADPVVAVAWSDARPDDPAPRRGPTAAIVAGPHAQRDRTTRLAALLVTQLRDEGLATRAVRDDDAADALRQALSEDAAMRQGAEPSR